MKFELNHIKVQSFWWHVFPVIPSALFRTVAKDTLSILPSNVHLSTLHLIRRVTRAPGYLVARDGPLDPHHILNVRWEPGAF